MALSVPNLSGDTLEDVAAYAAEFAENTSIEFDNFMSSLKSVLSEVDFRTTGDYESLNYMQWDYGTEIDQVRALAPDNISVGTSQVDQDLENLRVLSAPTAPAFLTPVPSIPPLTAQKPSISMPNPPTTDVGDAPTDAPSIEDVNPPSAPAVVLPNAPTFEELQLPVAPSITIPALSLSQPVNNITAPTNTFAFVDEEYLSTLHDPLVAKLLSDLVNGGYGIESNDEAGLWSRARDRAEMLATAEMQEAMRAASKLSFPMPQGALFQQLEAARQKLAEKMADVNRDIALKRGDMYVENRKFTIQEVRQYETVLRNFHNAVQERALNVARYGVELGIAVFDASVRNFNSQLDAYKTEAQVFETKIRAELAKAEIYKAQISAEQLRLGVDQAKVQLYTSQLQGIQTVVDVYRSRVQAANLQMQLQAQKMEVFRTRVQAYAMKVQAKASEYDMYKARIAGENAKLDVYKTDIQAYEAEVRGEEARIRALLGANQSLAERYRAQIAQYQAQLATYSKIAEARIDKERTLVGAHQSNTAVFRALVDAIMAGTNARLEGQRVNNAWNIAALNSRVDVIKNRLEQFRLTVGKDIDISRFGAQTYKDVMTSLTSSIAGLSVNTTEG